MNKSIQTNLGLCIKSALLSQKIVNSQLFGKPSSSSPASPGVMNNKIKSNQSD